MKKILLLKLCILTLTLLITTNKWAKAQTYFQDSTAIYGLDFAVGRGASAFADYNNDGKLELLATGDNNGTYFARIYKKDATGVYRDSTATVVPGGLTGVALGSVAWGDFNNDGYLDFIIAGITSGSTSATKLYKNNGNGTFTLQSSVTLQGISWGSLVWGDYNNDGYLDLLISGRSVASKAPYPYSSASGDGRITKIYRNNGDGTFTDLNVNFGAGAEQGTAAFADYNNDGLLDVFIGGYPVNATFFKNNGDGTFTIDGNRGLLSAWSLRGATVVFGDYNNDGYIDALATFVRGITAGQEGSELYYGNKTGTFTKDVNFVPGNLFSGTYNDRTAALAFGDFNNDGYLDIIATGSQSNTATLNFKIFKNKGKSNNYTFADTTAALFSAVPGGLRGGSAQWVDINNDGRLDFVVNGNDNTTNNNIGKNLVFINKGSSSLTSAVKPINLSEVVNGDNVSFSWDRASATRALLQPGLIYILRVGKTPGGSEIIKPISSVSNKNKTTSLGLYNDTAYLRGLDAGTYYWSVQAVNPNFTLGPWSDERSFTTSSQKSQAQNITFTQITPTTVRINWQNGTGGNRVVFVDSGMVVGKYSYKQVPPSPVNNTTYVANTVFGTAAAAVPSNTGWYCVYNGTGNYVDINGLSTTNTSPTGVKTALKYNVVVYEYSGAPGLEVYDVNTGLNNPLMISPTINANMIGTGLGLTAPTSSGFTATWKNGNGMGRAVYVKEGSSATNVNIPITNNYRTPNTVFGKGDQIGSSGWYCVYDGTGNTITITGLKGLTQYTVRVCEYNNVPSPIYLPIDTIGNPIDITTTDYSAPTKQATNVQITNVTSTKFDVKCNKGNGSQRVMFVYKGTSGTTTPVNNTTYIANAAFGLGTQVGTTGWYCIYNGTDSVVTVTGINSVNSYVVKVCEYNGSLGHEKYITSDTINNPGALINNRADQNITMVTNTSKTFGNADFDLAATASSGLPVSYSSSDATIATIVSGMVHIVGAGKCIITALQPGDINYNSAPPASDTLVVSKATSTITFDPLPNKTMIDAPFTVSATASSGLPVTFSSSTPTVATLSGSTITIVGMGTDTITANQTGNNNYLAAPPVKQTFAVTKVPQTITFGSLPTLKNSDPNYKLEATASSGLKVIFRSNDLTVAAIQGDVTGDYIHLFGAGTCIITASQPGNSIYLPATSVPQTLTVTSTTDVLQLATDEVLAYPNPASDKITITLGKSLLHATIGVYSLTGQQMAMVKVNSSIIDINVSDLKPGIYTIKIINANGIIVKQIVKQ